VSTSGFYDWRQREAAGPTERELAEAELVELMREIFDASDGNYGVPRMFTELRRVGLVVNNKKVRRLMRLHGMAGRCRRRRCHTTFPGPDGYVIPDLIGRCFEPGAPDHAWVQDITYVATGEGWLYLASVLDLGSRRLLGYSMADHLRTELVLDALGMAVAARGGVVAGVIAHADRGSQPSTPPTTTSTSVTAASCDPRSVAPGCAGTTPSPSRSGNRSNESASRAACSPPAPRPAERSSVGSTGTTRPGCTPPSTTPHPSSGNSSTVKRHNHRPADGEMARPRADATRATNRRSMTRRSALCPGPKWSHRARGRHRSPIACVNRRGVGLHADLHQLQTR
jgi:transposase InsO family protein